MPATSRTAGCGGPPLGQRPGRLALEVDQRPLTGRGPQALPEVQVAVHPLGGPGVSLGGQVVQRGERRAQAGGVRPQRGHRVHGGLQPLGHAVDHQPQLGVAQGDRRQRAGQHGVHLGGGASQVPCLGDEVLALGEFPQRQLPAVRRALHERLEHPQDVRLDGLRRTGGHLGVRDQPGRGRGHPGAARTGQRQRQLQVRVDPGHDPAQQFQDERVSVDDRRVRLLGGHQTRHQTGPDLPVRVPLETEPADPGLGAQGLQEQFGGPGVVQGLVDRPSGQGALRHMTDQRGREPGAAAPRARL
ncbi:hypothetical protein SGRIM128S_09773 [Streptomyces griseomycini]